MDSKSPTDEQLRQARRDLAKRIRTLRDELGLTQCTAAERAGITQGAWSNLERDKHEPQFTNLLRVQHALQLESIESLMGDQPSRRVLLPRKHR